MSQDLFSFQQFLIGLLRQSSSHQSIWDSVEISRVLHQITGLEFCVTPAPSASGTSTTENTARKSPDVSASTAHHISTTTQHLQQETTSHVSDQATKSPDKSASTAHHISATTEHLQQETTSHVSDKLGKSLNDDDNSSFHSCFDDLHQSRGIFDEDDMDRFPPNSCVYTVNDPSFKPSWSWVPYSHKKNRTYLRCLGVYICPMDGCKHICNAVLSNGNRKKDSVPKPRGSGFCFTHKCPLTHVLCGVECTLIRTSSSTEVKQNGSHRHPRPHEIKVSKKAVKRLQDIVRVNSEAKPIQVMLGTPTRESARSIHPSLGNLSRLSYMMNKFKSSSRSLDLEGILSIQQELGVEFINVCDLIKGVVVLQFPAMKMIIQNNHLYALQTDTLEGWILQGKTESFKWNAHVTSVHSDTIGRHVPVLISLTRSRTSTDYKIHFDHLFKSMECQSLDQFLERFPGNISDFSASEQAGFRTSLMDLATSMGHETVNVDKLMQRTYKFCEVSARVWPLACK